MRRTILPERADQPMRFSVSLESFEEAAAAQCHVAKARAEVGQRRRHPVACSLRAVLGRVGRRRSRGALAGQELLPVLRHAGAELRQLEILAQTLAGGHVIGSSGTARHPCRGAGRASSAGFRRCCSGRRAAACRSSSYSRCWSAKGVIASSKPCARALVLGDQALQRRAAGLGDAVARDAPLRLAADPVLERHRLGDLAVEDGGAHGAAVGAVANDDAPFPCPGRWRGTRPARSAGAGLGAPRGRASLLSASAGGVKAAVISGMFPRRSIAGISEMRCTKPPERLIHERVVAQALEPADLAQDGRGMAARPPRQIPDRPPGLGMNQIVPCSRRNPGRKRGKRPSGGVRLGHVALRIIRRYGPPIPKRSQLEVADWLEAVTANFMLSTCFPRIKDWRKVTHARFAHNATRALVVSTSVVPA